MSQENLEAFRRGTVALNRRDMDSFLELMDDAVEAMPRLVSIEGSYHGHDGIRRWWRSLFEAFPDYTVEIAEEHETGEMTLVGLRWRAHGAGSDAPFDETIWQLVRWKRGKCIWWRVFENRNEALEAAGLSE